MAHSNNIPGHYVYPDNPYTITVRSLLSHPADIPLDEPLPVWTYPVDKSHRIVPGWEEISDKIVVLLDEANIKWSAIECFKRKQARDQSEADHTKVLITVGQLPEITDEVQKLLHEIYEFSERVPIELVEGRIVRGACTEPESTNGVVHSLPYDDKPPMGGSIGVSNIDWSTGTFGGYLELFKEEDAGKTYGLTCHYVARPHKEQVPPEREFHPFKDGDMGEIRICNPSISDHEKTMSVTKRHVQTLQKKLQDKIARMELLNDMDIKTAENISKLQYLLRQPNTDVQSAESSNREIGTVFASSGYSMSASHNCQLDWALIDLHEGKIGKNIMPGSSTAVTGWSFEFDDEIPVYAFGRSSRHGTGLVNAVSSYISFKDTNRERKTREWCIVNVDGQLANCKGDSGAWVINPIDKNLLGILWGGRVDDPPPRISTYFTPIDIVAKHIREVTDYRVRLPGGPEIV